MHVKARETITLIRRLFVVLIALAAILALVDLGSAAAAEFRVSRALRAGSGLETDPSVRITGWAFLPQLTSGTYHDIEVSAHDVPAADVSNTTVEASLFGAVLPASDLVGRRFADLPVSELYGRIRIDGTDLGEFLGIPDLGISEPDRTPGSPEQTRETRPRTTVLTGTVPVDGEDETISVDARLAMDGNRIVITPTGLHQGPDGSVDIEVSDAQLPGILAPFGGVIDAGTLPFGVPVTWIYTEGSQIVIEGITRDVTVDLTTLRRS